MSKLINISIFLFLFTLPVFGTEKLISSYDLKDKDVIFFTKAGYKLFSVDVVETDDEGDYYTFYTLTKEVDDKHTDIITCKNYSNYSMGCFRPD